MEIKKVPPFSFKAFFDHFLTWAVFVSIMIMLSNNGVSTLEYIDENRDYLTDEQLQNLNLPDTRTINQIQVEQHYQKLRFKTVPLYHKIANITTYYIIPFDLLLWIFYFFYSRKKPQTI